VPWDAVPYGSGQVDFGVVSAVDVGAGGWSMGRGGTPGRIGPVRLAVARAGGCVGHGRQVIAPRHHRRALHRWPLARSTPVQLPPGGAGV